MMISRWRFILQLSIITVILGIAAGCGDLHELNKSTFLTGVALEPGEFKKVRVTAEMLNASENQTLKGGKGATPIIVLTMEGNTISEALQRLNEKIDRHLNISHMDLIVIDERLARLGLNRYMDVMQRSRHVREDSMILISRGTEASKILKVLYTPTSYPSLKILSQASNSRIDWGGSVKSRLYELNRALSTPGRQPILTAVTIKGSLDSARKVDTNKYVTPPALVELAGAAVFRQDCLIGYLSLENVRALQMAVGRLDNTILSVPLEQPNAYATIRVLNAQSRRTVVMKEGEPEIRLKVTLEGNVTASDVDVDLNKVSGYRLMEDLTSAFVKKQIEGMLEVTGRELGVDVVGFGEYLYRWHYKQFQPIAARWDSIYAESDVQVTVSTNLRRSELKTGHIERVEQ